MIKSFKYRIYPTDSQIKRLEETFDSCRFLYNCALEERIYHYKKYGKSEKSINYIYQQNLLPQIKDLFPEYKNVYSQVLHSTLKRLDNAYKGFFRRLKKHVYDYVVTDSEVERKFVNELDISDMIEVYAKLPNGFRIPTPLGTEGYNPDWAIAFKEGSVKHVLFVAETKGSMSSMQLRVIEKGKIDCARKYFERLEQETEGEKVKFNMVASYGELLNKVS